MTGLLLKDWYVARRYCRLHFGIIVLMTILSLFVDTGMAYLLYPILFAGMIPVYVLSAEEKSGWESIAATLPVSRRMITGEKYVASVMIIACTVVFMGIVWSARLLLSGGLWNGIDWYGLGRILSQLVCFGCVFPILTLPPMFRFGVEKGRVVTIAVAALAAVGIVMLIFRTNEINQSDVAGAMGWHVPAMLVITAVLLLLSWLLSSVLYEKREL